MVKIDFSAVLKGIDGTAPIKDEAGKDFTLGSAVLVALLASFPDDREISGTQKASRFKLALRVEKGGCLEVTSDEVVEMKKVVGKAYAPLVVGRAYEVLDPIA